MIRRRGNNGVHVNVAPLVDVLLVLIIILMIASYVGGNNGIEVDLPKTESVPLQSNDVDPIMLTISDSHQIHINNQVTTLNKLSADIEDVIEKKKTNIVYVRCDQNVSYGYAMEIMARVSSTTTAKVALVTEFDSQHSDSKAGNPSKPNGDARQGGSKSK